MAINTTVSDNKQKVFKLLTEAREILIETISEDTYGYEDLTNTEELENMIMQIRKMKEQL